MIRIERSPIVLIAGAALLLLAGCGGSGSNKAGGTDAGNAVVLTLANASGDSQEVDGFAAEVARLSRGTLRIAIKSRWRYGQVAYENGLINDVRAGRAELGVAGARAWDSVGVNSFRALDAPLLVDSYALQQRVLQSPLIAPMLGNLSRLGLFGLGVLPGVLRYPLGIAHPLLGPADYSGLRIGVQQSRVWSATMKAVGAKPVWFGAGASIAGFGGLEQGISAIEGDQYGRIGRFLTANVVLWARPLVVFANAKALAKLTPSQRRILSEAANADVGPETRVVERNQAIDAAVLCRAHQIRFVMASRSNLAALERMVRPVYAALERDPQTRADINQIKAMSAGQSPEPALRCSTATAVGAQRGQLDGIYQFTVSVADMRAAHADPSELVPENLGLSTFVFDRGRFAATQSYPQGGACTWEYGTLTVTGNTLTPTVIDGGGIAPTGATSKPGEQFTFDWSLYRDILTLRLPQGPGTGPTGPVATGWRRVSTTPSRKFFSKRCPPPANALPS